MNYQLRGTGDTIGALYRKRFSDRELARKDEIWQVIVSQYLSKWIPRNAAVLDIACGCGEFLNHVSSREKTGIDINPNSRDFLNDDVVFHNMSALECEKLEKKFDVIFMSNLLEHFNSKKEIEMLFHKLHALVEDDGIIIIMGPNYRLVSGKYWDFWDHHIALTDRSLCEILGSSNFDIVKAIPAFLPFSTKSLLPTHPMLVSLYLHLPLIWPILGKQFLIVCRKQLPPE